MAQQNDGPRTMAQLLKIPDSQMTKEEKLLRYGPGNTDTMRYAIVTKDGVEKLVSRTFKKGDPIPEGWEDSPMKFGIETEPQSGPKDDFDYDSVVLTRPAAPAPASEGELEGEGDTKPKGPKATKAAAK